MTFTCDTCGNEVTLEEGTLSWVDEGNSLRDFKITHKNDQNHDCDPKHVAYIHLRMATGLVGYMKLSEIMAGYWGKGHTLDDVNGLKRVLNQIGVYIWEKSKNPVS